MNTTSRARGEYRVEKATPFQEINSGLLGAEIAVEKTLCFVADASFDQIERLRAGAITPKPSYTAFIVKALAIALREHPHVNARFYSPYGLPMISRVQFFEHVDIAVAVERFLPGEHAATFIDVLRDADLKSLEELQAQLLVLSKATPETNAQWGDYLKTVRKYPSWLVRRLVNLPAHFPKLWVKYRGGAGLVSSPAKYGVDLLAGWWTSPLGVSFGLVEKRVRAVNDQVAIVPSAYVSLNWDRRTIAGAQAAQFFARFVDLLENAEAELTKPAAPRPARDEAVAVTGIWRVIERLFAVGKRSQ